MYKKIVMVEQEMRNKQTDTALSTQHWWLCGRGPWQICHLLS